MTRITASVDLGSRRKAPLMPEEPFSFPFVTPDPHGHPRSRFDAEQVPKLAILYVAQDHRPLPEPTEQPLEELLEESLSSSTYRT